MPLVHHTPSPPLSDFVATFWLWESEIAPPHQLERLLPTGTVELVINLHEDETRIYENEDPARYSRHDGAVLCGPHSGHFVIDTASQKQVLGIHFRPGGAFPFLPLPADELQNQHVSLDALWGRNSLRERLLGVPTTAEKFRILEAALLERRRRALARHPAVALALREISAAPECCLVGELCDRAGLSSRRFIELFRSQVGLTPKLFARVRRFQQVLSRIRPGQPVDWLEVALGAGYYDQAHFIHDFRDFSGMTPVAYSSLCTEHQNHVPLELAL